MNLAQVRTQIDRRTGVAQDTPAANAYVNEALNLISNRREWPWLDAVETITLTTATSYPVATDYSETRALSINGIEARRIYISQGDAITTFDDWNADYVYTLEEGAIQVFPQPPVGQVITHRYVRTEPLLSGDTSTPLLPERYHTTLCDLAAALFLERVDTKRSEYYHDRYEKNQKLMFEAVQRQAGPARIRIRGGAWY